MAWEREQTPFEVSHAPCVGGVCLLVFAPSLTKGFGWALGWQEESPLCVVKG